MSERIRVPRAALLAAMACLACVNEPGSSSTTTVTRRAVSTPSAPSAATVSSYRKNDFGSSPSTFRPLPPGPPVTAPSQPAAVSAAQYPGHFRNKVVNKPAADPLAWTPPPASAAYIAKQNDYARQLKDLEPTIAGLPADEQATRRADLKRSVLGN